MKGLVVLLYVLLCDYLTSLRADFLVPQVDDDTEVFTKGSTDYIFVKKKTSQLLAEKTCENYGGELLTLSDMNEAKFLAEALSETDMLFDTLWTAGVKSKSSWYWRTRRGGVSFSDELLQNIVAVNNNIELRNRTCIGFGRNLHDQPQLRPLFCSVSRSIICARPKAGQNPLFNSTHPGWIRIGHRSYKIFSERVDYFSAALRCLKHDNFARLAVIPDYKTAQILGRYLLIGRPSLENAWTEGRWRDGKYKYMSEPNIRLDNKTDSKGYPPWKNNEITKAAGCILLDRHLSNISLFVESRCERLRPYICYKKDDDLFLAFDDVIIGNNGYRLIRFEAPWNDANQACLSLNTTLAEPSTAGLVNELIFVMGENLTAVQHIWIGGRMIEKDNKMIWVWVSNSANIILENLAWVKNETYHKGVEEQNICLNMDRENHNVALHYGTFCDYKQYFVCQTTKEYLLQLQSKEQLDIKIGDKVFNVQGDNNPSQVEGITTGTTEPTALQSTSQQTVAAPAPQIPAVAPAPEIPSVAPAPQIPPVAPAPQIPSVAPAAPLPTQAPVLQTPTSAPVEGVIMHLTTQHPVPALPAQPPSTQIQDLLETSTISF